MEMPEEEPFVLQVPASSIPARGWDAAVVGAGPAGAAAAHLAAEGYHVLLLDRDAFPRDKTCGDGLLPDAIGALGRLGLREIAQAAGRRWAGHSVWSPGQVRVDVPGDYLTLRRSRLDALLAERAVKAGACFARGCVLRLAGAGGPQVVLRVAGLEHAIHARFAVLATGARLDILRRLGLPVPPSPPDAVGITCYARSSVRAVHLAVSRTRLLADVSSECRGRRGAAEGHSDPEHVPGGGTRVQRALLEVQRALDTGGPSLAYVFPTTA
ncbi:MAG: NAD(P)/FAD-dependent oxidoreductase [Deferrisomatales bacterium]